MTSHAPLKSSRSSARCGVSRQQFGSNTVAAMPADWRTPANRHTPSGGARKVYSPQCGSYGPSSNTLGAPSWFLFTDIISGDIPNMADVQLHLLPSTARRTIRVPVDSFRELLRNARRDRNNCAYCISMSIRQQAVCKGTGAFPLRRARNPFISLSRPRSGFRFARRHATYSIRLASGARRSPIDVVYRYNRKE
jgi:hypothetical protein